MCQVLYSTWLRKHNVYDTQGRTCLYCTPGLDFNFKTGSLVFDQPKFFSFVLYLHWLREVLNFYIFGVITGSPYTSKKEFTRQSRQREWVRQARLDSSWKGSHGMWTRQTNHFSAAPEVKVHTAQFVHNSQIIIYTDIISVYKSTILGNLVDPFHSQVQKVYSPNLPKINSLKCGIENC